ncbi:MAG: carbamoyltransferase HypF [Candidatus Hydrogenedentes bacterium]|nr:carbamoyltransferase HypF [Candidatus Hydrogenedentota bacterium]
MDVNTIHTHAVGSHEIVRVHVVVRGAVQGIGFRPFVYRLALELDLVGTVANSPYGLVIDAEGQSAAVQSFLRRLHAEKPPLSRIETMDVVHLAPVHAREFAIVDSEKDGDTSAFVMPDIAVCAECLREMRDPSNRRYRYPFINCTHCGPRFSLVHAMPYDRPNTSMRAFRMCAQCRDEYEDPADRRFHAQPIACANCGPSISIWGPEGDVYASHHDALLMAATEVRAGRIVAVKGLGGFQLVADARDAHAVALLRKRKHRDEKPFAVMYPDLDMVRADCDVLPLEAALLVSPESPIVLLNRRRACVRVAANVAPGVATLGVMLPYTPLHHLLLDELGFPIVATSGNKSDEPICIDEHEALERLGGIADFFLVHDRPIVRQMDDSIARVIAGREMVLRRARGYAPLPIDCGETGPCTLSAGAHLKNTVAVSKGCQVFVSQHIGDLESVQAVDAFKREVSAMTRLFGGSAEQVACDLHPDYASTKLARATSLPVRGVQHHYAHILACMAEHKLEGPVLGVSWDGTGLGTDGRIWGGEFLRATRDGFTRIAHLREFRLPGGDQAIREPRRSALSVLMESGAMPVEVSRSALDRLNPARLGLIPTLRAFRGDEIPTLIAMIQNRINSPVTTSAGRLFDAVASICGVCQRASYEGQAAMLLEALAKDAPAHGAAYRFDVIERGDGIVLDWAPVIRALAADVRNDEPPQHIAACFHDSLATAILEVSRRAHLYEVVLSGGCFQNSVLAERTIALLTDNGFLPHWHRFVPPNDGGIALGQAVFAMRHPAEPSRCA